MSNVKDIDIEARVPFCWLQDYGPDGTNPLGPVDVAAIGSWLLSPAVNLDFDYTPDGYVENDRGGRTAMYLLHIYGTEAIAYPAIDRICEIIRRSEGGRVLTCTVHDLEA